MKTILVIYTSSKIIGSKNLRNKKHYAFNTSSELNVGDMLDSSEYDSNMQVTKVLDKSFKYFNASTGELSDEFTSTAQHEIASLEVREDDENVVYATKISDSE